MKKINFSILIFLILFSCNQKQEKLETRRPLTYSKDSVLVPKFKVALNLSEKAKSELKQKNESIIIFIEFIGTPEVLIPENYKYEYYNELGQIDIGYKSVELKNQMIYNFNDCKVSADLIKLLHNKTYNARISVVSGRKSSKDNLLDCEYFEKNIDSIANKTIEIKGKLIEES